MDILPGAAVVDAAYSSNTDPRFVRRLPWIPHFYESTFRMAKIGIWAVFFSITIWLVPMVFIGGLVSRRAWSIKQLLALPLVVGLILFSVWIVRVPQEDFEITQRLFAGGAAVAPLVMFASLVATAWRQRWRRLFFWTGMTFVISAAVATTLLIWPFDSNPVPFKTHYSMSGWYAVWFAGAYLTSWLCVAECLWRWVRNRFRKSSTLKRLDVSAEVLGALNATNSRLHEFLQSVILGVIDEESGTTVQIIQRRGLRVDADGPIECREHLLKVHRPFHGMFAKPIGRPNHLPCPHSATGENRAADFRPVITPTVLIDSRRTSKLPPHNNRCIVEHSASVKIID